jgi:hypothetical protein
MIQGTFGLLLMKKNPLREEQSDKGRIIDSFRPMISNVDRHRYLWLNGE